jgi:hypothetical protein
MNVVAMVSRIQRLRDLPQYAVGQELHLIVDTYAAHRCQIVRDLAQPLTIEMPFIPARATTTIQPLDRYVFGSTRGVTVKSAQGSCRAREANADQGGIVLHLRAAWEAVNRTTLERAWEIHEAQ